MKKSAAFFILIFMCTLQASAAQAEKKAEEKQPEDSRIRIGVLDCEITGTDKTFHQVAGNALRDAVDAIGFYAVSDQDDIEKSFKKISARFPRHCRDPRCVLSVGKTITADRMLYGTMNVQKKSFGIHLILMDVQSRQTIEQVQLQSAPGVELSDLLHVAILKLHGHDDKELSTKTSAYFGPEIHHEKEMLFSSAGVIGAGIIWALANGGFKSQGSEPSWLDDYRSMEKSGIVTNAYHIPMFARPAALANAYTAVADDAQGVLYNPAGMAWVQGREAALSYQYRFGLLNNLQASYVNKASREIGFGHTFMISTDKEGLMTEAYFATAIAYKFHRLVSFLHPVSFGGTVKIGSKKADGDSAATASMATFGLAFDVGMMWEIRDNIRYGVVLKDIPALERVHNEKGGYDYFEPYPMSLTMGGLFRAGYSTTLVADGRIPLYEDQPWKMAGGIEQDMFRYMKLRIGIQKEIQANQDTPWRFTGGAGLDVPTDAIFGKYITFDASYEYNTIRLFDVINTSIRVGF